MHTLHVDGFVLFMGHHNDFPETSHLFDVENTDVMFRAIHGLLRAGCQGPGLVKGRVKPDQYPDKDHGFQSN